MTDKEFKMTQDEQMVALESTWDLKPPNEVFTQSLNRVALRA